VTTLLYRFNDLQAFPVLKGESSVRTPVVTRLEGMGGPRLQTWGSDSRNHSGTSVGPGTSPHLRLLWTRQNNDPPEAVIVMGLPFRAIEGAAQRLMLDVYGDAGGSHLCIEAGDASGWGFACSFGVVDFTGWRTCHADARDPCEFWGAHTASTWTGIASPLQLHRLRIMLAKAGKELDLRFATLTITGDVRIANPGVA
jgi:hypothetical protein